MSNTRKIIIISIAAFGLVVLLLFALYKTLGMGQQEQSSAGLLKPNETVVPSAYTEEEREKDYGNRNELPETVAENLNTMAKRYLSSGDFDGLNKRLTEWLDNYKDTTDDALDETIILNRYQADIAFFKNVTDPENLHPVTEWQFSNPDVLAAAISYAPISTKYQTIISRRSAILPEALSSINLEESEMTPQELRSLLDKINLTRTEDTEFKMVTVYDVEIRGIPCEITMVSDSLATRWQVYSIQPKDGTDLGITVQTCYDIVDGNIEADLDSIIVMPEIIE